MGINAEARSLRSCVPQQREGLRVLGSFRRSGMFRNKDMFGRGRQFQRSLRELLTGLELFRAHVADFARSSLLTGSNTRGG